MDKKLRKLQLKELELFKKFDSFCKKNKIEYYALGGTLLGAIRHHGFIPWDDDMDIGIPRPDYERFLDLCANNEINFELHTFKNDCNYFRYFSRIEDPSMKVKRTDNQKEEISSAWIDIFPLDGMPNNKIKRFIWEKYLLYRRAIFKLSCFDTAVNLNKKNRPTHERILIMLGKKLPVQRIFKTEKELLKLDKALKKYDYNQSNYLVNAMGAYKFKEMFHKKYYGNGKMYSFEDVKIRGPVNYNYVLKQLYGDYMILPKDSEKNKHSLTILDK